jgi:ATP-dependent DNA helicase RecG
VMHAFVEGKIHVLVATTVVEVGVDVPNATVMIIEDADRFGLAQLHQLRGRVGRGAAQSTCILTSKALNLDTQKRLDIMTQTQNGFEIAEYDLQLRGPGEFLGTKQSGLPDFLLSDLTRDKDVLEHAREAAFNLLAIPDIETQYPLLMATIQKKTESSFSVLGSG